MAENPPHRDDRDIRRERLGAALRENLKRRKAQARGRDGNSSLRSSSMASSRSDSVDAPANTEKKDD